jgi:glutamate-1-semialdehyde 2,1-aminomutase
MNYARSQELFAEAKTYLAGGVSSNFRYAGYGESPVPIFYQRGEGSHLYDVDGNVFIDYALANGPIILGHAPEPVLRAVTDSLSMGQLFAGQHELEIDLARRICELVPCAELVRFASSGSEADQAAIRLARAKTGRRKIVKFEGHYHGWFDNIFISIAPSPNEAGPAEAPVAVAQTPGQSESALEDVIVLPWNDLELFRELVETRGDEIAGVVMEPILCNTGAIMPRPGYLEGVRELTERAGIVLIFDEVITGVRVSLNGAQGLLGVTPDLAVFAKAMAAGFTMAALVGKREIMERLDSKKVMHGGTYNSNVVATAAAIATLEELSRHDGRALRDMTARGERLMSALAEVAASHGQNLRVRGFGSVFHPAFADRDPADYREFLEADAGKRARFNALLHEEGVRVTARGTWFLSTAHDDADVDETIAAADRAFTRLRKEAAA